MPAIRPMLRPSLLLLTALWAWASAAAPLLAEPSDPKSDPPLDRGALTEDQNRLVEEGLALRGKGEDRKALEVFRSAQDAGQDARILAQIAFAEQALGRWVVSYRHLSEALSDTGHPWIEANRTVLEPELQSISSNVGRMEVSVSVPGAEVSVNGKPVGPSPLGEAVIVLPGSIHVRVEAPGYMPNVRQVMVPAGKLARTEITLLPESTLPDPVTASEPSPAYEAHSRRRPAWLYVAGGGVLMAVSSAIPWKVSEGKLRNAGKKCPNETNCSLGEAEANDIGRDVERLDRTTSALLFSGIGVTVGATLAYVFWKEEYQSPVHVSAWGGPLGAGLHARVRF